jgi:hypothetical protein
LKIILSLILIFTISFIPVFADTPKSFQEQLIQQITSLLHFKSGYVPIEMSKTQIVEYSIIVAISIVVIITIASSINSKNKKPIRK